MICGGVEVSSQSPDPSGDEGFRDARGSQSGNFGVPLNKWFPFCDVALSDDIVNVVPWTARSPGGRLAGWLE